LAAFSPLMTGCVEDEAGGRAAAYPEPIGYTPPPHAAPPAPAEDPALLAGQPEAAPPTAAEAEPPAAAEDATQSGEVVIGEEPPAGPPGEEGEYQDTDPSALSDFRSTLDPYGTWTEDPTYGTVWVPSPTVVGSDFTPYVSAGHWAYDDDYVWVSDYQWGWAPFHYGRWVWAGPG
jgi:hypothetical protein